MTKVILTESSLEDIADAIRDKNGEETLYKPREMAEAIRAIDTDCEWGEIGGDIADQTDLQTALAGKEDTLTWDSTPTDGSTNPVTSDGIYDVVTTLNADLASKADDDEVVKSVNSITPINGDVAINAEDIPAEGIGDKTVTGNPIVISDAMQGMAKELSVTLEPVQDLHGYDHPWVGGAGKNLLPMTVDGIKAANTGGTWTGNTYERYGLTYAIETDAGGNVTGIKLNGTATMGAEFIIYQNYSESCPFIGDILSGCYANGSSSTYYLRVSDMDISSSSDYGSGQTINISSTGHWKLVIGWVNGMSFSNAVFKPMIRLSTVSDSTFEPYTNICPIYPAGYDSTYVHGKAEVQRTGKNLVKNIVRAFFYVNDSTARFDNDSESVIFYAHQGQTYVRSGSPAPNRNTIARVDTYDVTSSTPLYNATALTPNTWTATWTGWTIWYCYGNASDAFEASAQVEIGTTATTHESYVETTALIPFTSDVYGCQQDMITGKCVVTKVLITLSGTTMRWAVSGNNKIPEGRKVYYIMDLFDNSAPALNDNNQGNVSMMSNVCQIGTTSYNSIITETDFKIGIGGDSTGSTIGVNTDIANLQDFKDWVDATGIQLVYPLKTPIELDLTPAQLTLLQGTNVLTADGTINLTYLGSMAANVQDEIDEFENATNNLKANFAPIEDGNTATSRYVAGDLLVYHNILCKAKVSIATGETLIIGTNIEATSVANECGYEDISDRVVAFNSRVSFDLKKCKRYRDGRTELYCKGTVQAELTSANQTLILMTGVTRFTYAFSGTANIGGAGYICSASPISAGVGLNVNHSGVASGSKFSLYVSWYE